MSVRPFCIGVSTYRESVAADVVRADRQVRHLEVLHAVNIGSLVQDTVLDDLVAFLGTHTTGTKRMPGSLAVTLHPLLNVCNILENSISGSMSRTDS